MVVVKVIAGVVLVAIDGITTCVILLDVWRIVRHGRLGVAVIIVVVELRPIAGVLKARWRKEQ